MPIKTEDSLTDPNKVISDEEVQQFRDQGFVFPKIGLPEKDAAHMRDVVGQVIADVAEWGILRMPHVPPREGQLEGLVGGEKIFEIALNPVLLAAARRLVGPDLIFWGGEIFAKPGEFGPRTPWHQDCYNPAIKPGPGRRFAESAMVWIAVDDVDPANGSLSFIPGSGRNGRIGHDHFDRTVGDLLNFQVDTGGLDMENVAHSTLKSGQFSVHDFYTVHGASANTSGRRRVGLTLHYMSARDIYDRSFGDSIGSGRSQPAPLAQRPIWLVLGENRQAENDFVTGHQNLGDLDAFAEETRRRLTPLYS